MLKVKDVLKKKGRNIWSISLNETVYRALELMAEKDIGALFVIESGQIAGIFTERDYARKVILKGKASKETLVKELMTKKDMMYSITSDKSVEECLALFAAARCRHMPVYENNVLIGLVTIGDIANTIIDEQKITISNLQNYITGSG